MMVGVGWVFPEFCSPKRLFLTIRHTFKNHQPHKPASVAEICWWDVRPCGLKRGILIPRFLTLTSWSCPSNNQPCGHVQRWLATSLFGSLVMCQLLVSHIYNQWILGQTNHFWCRWFPCAGFTWIPQQSGFTPEKALITEIFYSIRNIYQSFSLLQESFQRLVVSRWFCL